MPTLDQVKEQLRRIGISGSQTGHAAYSALPDVLREGEQIEAAVAGKYEGQQGAAVATDQRLVFIGANILFGRKLRTEDFTYSSITSVQVKHGHVFGEVEVLASGNKAKIEGVVTGNQAATDFAEHVKRRVAEAKAPAVSQATAPFDVAGQLERLAALRDRGILTEAEFQEQKVKILSM